jgi:hypothetical protein
MLEKVWDLLVKYEYLECDFCNEQKKIGLR